MIYALERYNRRMNEHFSNAHPNIFAFIDVLRNEFEFYEEKLLEIRQNSSGIVYKTPKINQNEDLKNFKLFILNKYRN